MRIQDLETASYKGVDFKFISTSTLVGRAKIKHEFANSNKNNIEDQGLNPRTYRLTAVISATNYRAERDRLLDAIESPGLGTLRHPFYGTIENAAAMPVEFNESITSMGRIEFPLVFEISDSDGVPTVARLSTSSVNNLAVNTVSVVSEDFGANFFVTDGFGGNFGSAQSKNDNFISAILNNVNITSILPGVSAEYRAKIDFFTRNANNLIGNPQGLGEGITGLMLDIAGLYSNPLQTYNVSRRFFTFGDDDVAINPTTAGLTERIANNLAYNEAVQISALSVAYEAASLRDYATVNDIDQVSRELEGEYRKLRFES